MNRRSSGRRLGLVAVVVLVAGVLSVLVAGFPVRVYEIPSGAMEITLHGCDGCTNDRVLVDPTAYWFGEPRPGDIVVFAGPPSWQDVPGADREFVERVVAVGGQTVSCCDARGQVVVDGRGVAETYIYYLPEAGPPMQASFPPVLVPPGDLWLMGDSRNNSADSRVPGHGPVPVDAVVGKVRAVLLPFSRFGSAEFDH